MWLTSANLIYAIGQFVTIVSITKLGSADVLGQYAFAQAVCLPMSLFFEMQLRHVQGTDQSYVFHFGHYSIFRRWSTVAFLITMVAIGITLKLDANSFVLIVLVACRRSVESIADIYYGAFMARESQKPVAASISIIAVTSLTSVILSLWIWHSLPLGLLISIIAAAGVVGLFLIPCARKAAAVSIPVQRIKTRDFTSLAKIGLPLGLVSLLMNIDLMLPRVILEGSRGTVEVGYYAGITYLVTAGATVVAAISQASMPTMARYSLVSRYHDLRRLAYILIGGSLMWGLIASALSFTIGAQVLGLIYSSDFADLRTSLAIVALASGFSYAAYFLGSMLTSMRLVNHQMMIWIAVLALSVPAGLVLIPRYGVTGAAMTYGLGSAMHLLASIILVTRHTRHAHGYSSLVVSK